MFGNAATNKLLNIQRITNNVIEEICLLLQTSKKNKICISNSIDIDSDKKRI